MKKTSILLLICFGLILNISAQKEARYWHFGDSAGIQFSFGSNPPPATALTNSVIFNVNGTTSTPAYEGVASLSDPNGNLLFYSDGQRVWNRNNLLMPFSSGTAPTLLKGNPSSTQSCIFFPMPGSNSKYYIFTTPGAGTDSLRYTVVDMSLNGGLGDVTSTVNVLAPGQIRKVCEKLTAIPHANGTDFWVIAHEYNTNAANPFRFIVYQVSASGVSSPTFTADPNFQPGDYYGYLKSNPAGTMLAMALAGSNQLRVFNFNSSTGAITLKNTITDNTYLQTAYGTEFSPDGKYLYATSSSYSSNAPNTQLQYLSQFNLQAGTQSDIDVLASRKTIYSYIPEHYSKLSYGGLGALQLGPDNRIYVTRGGIDSLSYIDLPNQPDTGSHFMLNAIPLLGHKAYNGLPNIISSLVIPPPTPPCNQVKAQQTDSNCCSAGFTYNTTSGSRVVSVKYQITGGVIQGYTTNCTATPVSASLSGTALGTVTMNNTCNLTFFNTALQSTTASGNMTVSYLITFANGDTCRKTVAVRGCSRMPKSACDSIAVKTCVCPGGAANYLDIRITNKEVPQSPICGVIIRKLDPSGNVVNSYFSSSSSLDLNPGWTPVNLSSMVSLSGYPFAQPGNVTHIQAYYAAGNFDGSLDVITIHCNGDTCKSNWKPNPCLLCVKYADYALKQTISPYAKIYGQTFLIKGPSTASTEPNPYKIRYITFSITDTAGNPEIAGTTGAELYQTTGKEAFLPISFAAHAKLDALIEFRSAIAPQPGDSSLKFQVFFGRALPKKVTCNYYDVNGSLMTSQVLAIDSGLKVGVIELGKMGHEGNSLQLFNGYPNPTNQEFNLMAALPSAGNYKLKVSDVSGKEVMKTDLGNLPSGISNIKTDLSELSTGMYFITIEGQGSNSQSFSNSIKVVLSK